MKRHIYKSPKGTSSAILAVMGGIVTTLAVFVTIPLSQKLNAMSQESPTYATNDMTLNPPDFPIEEQVPPPEIKPEPKKTDPIDPVPQLPQEIWKFNPGPGGGS